MRLRAELRLEKLGFQGEIRATFQERDRERDILVVVKAYLKVSTFTHARTARRDEMRGGGRRRETEKTNSKTTRNLTYGGGRMGWRRRREADGMEEGPERAGRRARAKNTHRETKREREGKGVCQVNFARNRRRRRLTSPPFFRLPGGQFNSFVEISTDCSTEFLVLQSAPHYNKTSVEKSVEIQLN